MITKRDDTDKINVELEEILVFIGIAIDLVECSDVCPKDSKPIEVATKALKIARKKFLAILDSIQTEPVVASVDLRQGQFNSDRKSLDGPRQES